MARPYTLGKRAAGAQQTRRRVLEAAAELLSRAGPLRLTIEAVAGEAGVSRVTVYKHFDSRAGLLGALAWWTFERHDISRLRMARLQPDVRAALGDFVRENARFFAAIGAQGRDILNAVANDPDVRQVVESTYVQARRQAITELVGRLAAENVLAEDWTPERAIDALMVITSLEAFETLTVHGHRDPEAAGELLADMTATITSRAIATETNT